MDIKRKNFLLKICLPLILAAVLITGVACFFCLKKPKPLQISAQDFVISQGETKLLDGSVFSVSQPYAVVTFEIEDEQILQKDGFSVKGIGAGQCKIVFVATWQNLSATCTCTATVTKPKDTSSQNSPSGSEQNPDDKEDENNSDENEDKNNPNTPDENNPVNPDENQGDKDENKPTNPHEEQKPQRIELVIDNTINCVYKQQTKTLTVPQGEKAGFTILVENSAQTNFESLLQNSTKSAWIDLWLENGIFFIQTVAPGSITFSVEDQQFEIFVQLQPRTETSDSKDDDETQSDTSTPDFSTDPELPQTPDTPQISDNTQSPDAPQNPELPTQPDTPIQPETNPNDDGHNSNETQNPDNSDNANETENPDNPQNQNNSQNPDNPQDPSNPQTPIEPETSNKPENQPEAPKNPEVEECDFYIYNAIGCEFDETTKILKVSSGTSVQFCLGSPALAVVRPSALLENCIATEGLQLSMQTYSLVGEMFCLTATKSGCIIFKISQTQQITLYVEIVD